MTSRETVSRIELALLDGATAKIADVLTDLTGRASTSGAALHPSTARQLASLVGVMNAYYSNLIEGHITRPRDIERALSGDLDVDEGRRPSGASFPVATLTASPDCPNEPPESSLGR